MSEITVPRWLFSKYPLVCTLCGGSFEKEGKRCLFPYPPNHYLCVDCFTISLDAGLGRLNKRLAMGNLDLSVEEITEEIQVRASLLKEADKI